MTTQFHDPNPRVMWLNCDPARGVIAEPKMHWAINYCLDRDKIGKTIWPVQVPPAQYPWADYPTNDKWKNESSRTSTSSSTTRTRRPSCSTRSRQERGRQAHVEGQGDHIEIITPSRSTAEFAIGEPAED